tara:strand:+ start:6140 stop:8071 length:1932 start_codon:yes stop_codon:yes gene_type:complete
MTETMLRAVPPAEVAPERDLLRFLTCGSVDDGKSTLIGRLLFESGQVPEDQLAALHRDSRRFGTTDGLPDYALLLDGLEAEREQGITIDVAYRYFSTVRRSFIVADTPGHEQYTRNMATGASTCEAAVILVDATRGVTDQTRRHSRIVSLFGIRHVILAVNKIDLIADGQAVFDRIRADYADFAGDLTFQSVTAIPLSARRGDNLASRSAATPWYDGPTLIDALEAVPGKDSGLDRAFRFPVQYVNRPNAGFRGYAGTVASGRIRTGDRVVVGPGGQSASVSRIVTWDGDRLTAQAGDAVTLVLDEAVDVSRGDVLAHPYDRPASVDRFAATLLWMDEAPLDPERGYLIRMGTRTLPARVSRTVGEGPELAMNGIADCVIALPSQIAFDTFRDDPEQGALILIDRETGATAAAGVAIGVVDQATNIHPSAAAVTRGDHARLNGHRGGAIWLTGLSGAGKSTVAAELQRLLHAQGVRTVLLDGDNLRHGLNRDLGFSTEDRAENVRRTGEVARLFAEAGVVALCALISPRQFDRDAVRARFDADAFIEVFVDAPLDVCRTRDPKGLYARATAGDIPDLTGVGSAYEAPPSPDVRLDTGKARPAESATRILNLMRNRGWLDIGPVAGPEPDRPSPPSHGREDGGD